MNSAFSTVLLRFGPAISMGVIVTVLSLAPAYFFREVESSIPVFPGFDKCVHGLMYFVLTLSALHALPRAQRVHLRTVAVVMVATSVYGVFMEFCQGYLTTTRSLDSSDILANAVGALCGAWFVRIASRHLQST